MLAQLDSLPPGVKHSVEHNIHHMAGKNKLTVGNLKRIGALG